MPRRHTFIIAALLAISVLGGSVALGRTLGLGAASTKANNAQVAARVHRLNAFEASLRRQLASAPVVPKAPSANRPLAQRVTYVRPAPIIVTKHRPGGAYEHEGDDHGEGGADD